MPDPQQLGAAATEEPQSHNPQFRDPSLTQLPPSPHSSPPRLGQRSQHHASKEVVSEDASVHPPTPSHSCHSLRAPKNPACSSDLEKTIQSWRSATLPGSSPAPDAGAGEVVGVPDEPWESDAAFAPDREVYVVLIPADAMTTLIRLRAGR